MVGRGMGERRDDSRFRLRKGQPIALQVHRLWALLGVHRRDFPAAARREALRLDTWSPFVGRGGAAAPAHDRNYRTGLVRWSVACMPSGVAPTPNLKFPWDWVLRVEVLTVVANAHPSVIDPEVAMPPDGDRYRCTWCRGGDVAVDDEVERHDLPFLKLNDERLSMHVELRQVQLLTWLQPQDLPVVVGARDDQEDHRGAHHRGPHPLRSHGHLRRVRDRIDEMLHPGNPSAAESAFGMD